MSTAGNRAAATQPGGLTSQALCRLAGLKRGALRLYEREGLIPPPPRSGANYRLYPTETVELVQAILSLREVGYSLDGIRRILSLFHENALPPERIRAEALEQIAVIEARIARLDMLRGYFQEVVGDPTRSHDPECDAVLRFLSAGDRPQTRKTVRTRFA